jgi:ribonuclease HI
MIGTNWRSSEELDLEGGLAMEWKHYRGALINVGVLLLENSDELIWLGGDASGQITVNNAFVAVENMRWNYVVGGWRKALWSWACPLKIKKIVWLSVENKILSWDNLQHRGFSGPGMCQLCNHCLETVYHLFVGCTFVTTVWNKIATSLNLTTKWTGDTLASCFKSWRIQNTLHPSLPTLICWYTWKERNLAIFEGGIPSIQKVFFLSISESWVCLPKTKVSCRGVLPTNLEGDGVIGWFDGATMSSGNNCGAGGRIKISEQKSYKWFINCGVGTNTKAELLGAWALLTLASRLSILEIHILGDSNIIIEWLKGKGHLQVAALECWKDRIRETIKLFWKISFAHIYRVNNKVADNLSKFALSQAPGRIVYYQCVEDHEGPYLFLDLY